MTFPAPKPENFDELTRTWNDPAAFARARKRYYEQIAATLPQYRDITEPLHTKEPENA